jgi:prepilin-type N-terminal cleavage/methylation domain-containing protein
MRPRRPGMTIIEVLFAIVILSGVMLGLSRFGQGFTRATRNAANLAIASDLASAKLEAVRGHGTYATLGIFAGDETAADASADPPMIGYEGYTRRTVVRREPSDTADFTIVTVTVTADVLTKPMVKTLVIGAF